MAKLPPPNLPPAAMPWARELEKRLGDADTKASRAYTNVGAFGQVIADVNNRNVTHTLDIEAHETKLTENAEAVAQAEAEIAALNAPGGPLDTLDQELQALDTQLNDPVTGISAQVAEFDEQLNTPLTGIADVVAAHTVDLGDLDDALNDPVTGVRPAIDALESDMNDPVTGVKAELDAAQSDLTNLTKVGGTLDVMQGEIDDKLDNLPGVITETLISDDAVTTSKIVANAITASELAVGAITASKAVIADGAILNAQIGDAAISAAKIQDAAIISAKIQDGAIVNAKIQTGTIQHAKIGTVSADSMTLGTLAAERIGAKTISAEKLVIGSGENLLTNPTFSNGGAGWVGSYSTYYPDSGYLNAPSLLVAAAPATVGPYLGLGDSAFRTPVTPGRSYHISVYARAAVAVPVQGVRIYVRAYRSDGTWTWATPIDVGNTSEIPANSWGRITGTFVFPEGYDQAVIGLYVVSTFDQAVRFSSPTMTLAASGELIVDGSITAEKVAAHSIGANKMLVGDFENMFVDIINDTNSTYPHVKGGEAETFTVAQVGADANGIDPGKHIYATVNNPASTNNYVVEWCGTNGSTVIPVEPDTEYAVSVLTRSDSEFTYPNGLPDTGWVVREYTANMAYVAFRGFGNYKAIQDSWQPHTETLRTGKNVNYIILYNRLMDNVAAVRLAKPSLRRKNGGSLIVDGSIVANHIATRTITAEKIGTGEITANEIKSGTITANEITTDYLTGIKISAGEITGTIINGGTINGTTVNSVDYTGTGMILRGAGESEYMQLAGDSIWFYIDGRARTLGAVDGSLGAAGTADADNGIVTVGAYSGSGLLNGFDVGRSITFRDGVSRITDLNAGVVSLHTADVTSKLDFNNGYGSYLKVTGNLVTDSRIYQAGSYLPQAHAAGITSWTGSALGPGSGTDIYVAFPSGRFTVPPVVTAVNATSPIIVSSKAVTTSGATLRLYNPHSANITPGDIHWTAMQMTPSSAGG